MSRNVAVTNMLAKALPAPEREAHAPFHLFVPHGSCAGGHWTICGNRKVYSNSHDDPPHETCCSCLMLSIGIGGEWDYEKFVMKRRCHVHAFDPTVVLLQKHKKQFAAIRNESRNGRLHFHNLGLGASTAMRTSYNKHKSTGRDLSDVVQLDVMMARYALGRRVDVLKIDCEGCVYGAFDYLIERAPRLLCNVTQLNIELHTQTHGYPSLVNASQLTRLLRHAWIDHGFRVFKAASNAGWKEAARSVHPTLVKEWGFPSYGCCHNVQMVRPGGRLDGTASPACS